MHAPAELHRPTTELRCLAQHPAARERGEAPGAHNHCRTLIQVFPLPCQPAVGDDGRIRVVRRWEEMHGQVIARPDAAHPVQVAFDPEREKLKFGVRCTDRRCKAITVYEIVTLPPGLMYRWASQVRTAGHVTSPAVRS
jgi:hypothetical protein